MSDEIKLVIPGGLTNFQGNSRKASHRFAKSKLNNATYNLIEAVAGLTSGIPKTPIQNPEIEIVVYRNLPMDYDNLVHNLKAHVDGLTRAQIIADDRWKIAGPWRVDQKPCARGEERVEFTIRERGEPIVWRAKKTPKREKPAGGK